MPNFRDMSPEQRAAMQRKSAETRRRNAATRGQRSGRPDPEDEPEQLENDGPEVEARGSSRERPRKPPKAVKSQLVNRMTERVATMGARSLQLLSYRAMGVRGMLTKDEAQGFIQPSARLITRRLAVRVNLPGMSGPDAEDAAEIILTLAEYILRLAAQALDAWAQRIFKRAEDREARTIEAEQAPAPQYQPMYATAAPAGMPGPGSPSADPTAPGGGMDLGSSPATGPGTNGHAAGSVFDLALQVSAPYTGGED